MVDANAEISRLRQRLKFKNLSDKVVDEICDEVSREISIKTSDALAESMQDAVNAGGDAKAIDFIDEIRAVRSGSSFDIVTDSGNTDFSEPPFPMLPNLLKNAKVAEDGSLYKVIPIRQKGDGEERNMSRITDRAMQNIENARASSKRQNGETKRTYSSPDAMRGMDTLSAMETISKSRNKQTNIRPKSTEPAVDFRTASSKQDQSTQWVHPGKKRDMGPALVEINADLHDKIDNIITEVIDKHESMY